MRLTLLTAAAGLSLLSTTALAQMAPQAFVDKASASSAYEIQSSQMILDAGDAEQDVQDFAQDMITDHTKATAELKEAASTAGLTVPQTLAPKQRMLLEQLETADNKIELYLRQQVAAHNEAVVLHNSFATDGEDETLKGFAEAQLPILREHLGHVEGLNKDDAGTMSGMEMPASDDAAAGSAAAETGSSEAGESGMATGSTSADDEATETSPSGAATGPITSGTVTTGGSGTGSGASGSAGTIDPSEGNSGGSAPQQ